MNMKEIVWNWFTAIGLQQVDGLKVSEYLYDTAKRNIDCRISAERAKRVIDNYYRCGEGLKEDDFFEEADKVSSRIVQVLSESSFKFSVPYLITIHKQLFYGLYEFAGKIRDYNITKREWALDGDTVIYGPFYDLDKALEYDLNQEKSFNYDNPLSYDTIKHIASFVSGIWQLHPFGEGNTRTIAVFIIKYLRQLGYKEMGKPFFKCSRYFRDALVRANYNNIPKGVHATLEYLELFFRNLLLGEDNELNDYSTYI